MLTPIVTRRFDKDIKRMKKRGKNIEELLTIIDLLIAEQPLPPKHVDHSLRGNYTGSRECHIRPDWLLIYTIAEENLILERTGTHSDLF